jgi:hypothetical protein
MQGGVVQATSGYEMRRRRRKGQWRTSVEDDGGNGTSPDDDECPALHGLEVGSEMSSPSGMAALASDGWLAQPYRITHI